MSCEKRISNYNILSYEQHISNYNKLSCEQHISNYNILSCEQHISNYNIMSCEQHISNYNILSCEKRISIRTEPTAWERFNIVSGSCPRKITIQYMYTSAGKVLPATCHEGAKWEWLINANLRPLYPPGLTPIPIGESWVGPRAGLEGFGKKKNPLRPPTIEPRTVQLVANRYTLKVNLNIIFLCILVDRPFLPPKVLYKHQALSGMKLGTWVT
jgi:hypothetical protein